MTEEHTLQDTITLDRTRLDDEIEEKGQTDTLRCSRSRDTIRYTTTRLVPGQVWSQDAYYDPLYTSGMSIWRRFSHSIDVTLAYPRRNAQV